MSSIEKYADRAMYESAPMPTKDPKITLLAMTPDPLGAIAAACRMYEGKVTYDLSEITDEERLHYWGEVQKTHLQAPLEFVRLHFFLEGVPRSFTHQMVRQRTAVYAQESLRFAVKENLYEAVQYPPSIAGTDQTARDRQAHFDDAVGAIQTNYNWLVANGVPAEDARELLPHATLTRLHYNTDLRNLHEHAGNRLCTQAQFIWRKVWLEFLKAIENYPSTTGSTWVPIKDAWQYAAIARGGFFVPACYNYGHCPFAADFDRGCTIRERVDANAAIGRPSKEWHQPWLGAGRKPIQAINPKEWLEDPEAAWVR